MFLLKANYITMARPKKIEVKEEVVKEEVVQPTKEQFDPSLPESKQRHLR
jgi:hypothetical protein